MFLQFKSMTKLPPRLMTVTVWLRFSRTDQLKKAQNRAEEADRKYDEAQKKMVTAEAQLEIDGERADVSEFKIIELEEELKVVANNLKSLEVSEDKANKRE